MTVYTQSHDVQNDREKRALLQIKEGASAYREAMKIAVGMKAAGATIEEIDKSIKGADKELGEALASLNEVILEKTEAVSLDVSNTAIHGEQMVVFIGFLVIIISIMVSWLTANMIVRPLKEAPISRPASSE